MDFPLPPVGEGLYEVELVRWLVQPGEAVHRGQSLMEVLSDKATMEVPSPFEGTVTETVAEAGAKIKVGEVVLRYEGEAGGVLASPTRQSGEDPVQPAPVPANPPAKREVVAATLPALTSGARQDGARQEQNGTATLATPAAAPSVRHLARKLGIDLLKVRGTGPAGRILLDDLAPFLKPKAAPDVAPKHGTDLTRLDFGVAGTRVKLVGLRRKIAERMVESKRLVPHYSYMDECELTDLVRLRAQIKDTYSKAGVKLTYLPFFVKAVARALKEIPVVNSTFDEATQEIILHDRYHIGIAVAAPNGLIVPVVKDADRRDIGNLATEIERLGSEARAGKSKLDDLRGGTFTITSIGGIGGLISTPIINHPEVGILGIGKVVKRPVYDQHGQLKPSDVVFLSFSFDHRIVDGAIGAAFGNAVIRHLHNPAVLLLPERLGG
jgi:pyruvate dehydrogenase E2 component (dihydrolipoamide acetyltransferase)/2-oxoisovalerate dehydrogenase E2 component (dihydrolipoyl transacylase)